MRFRKGSIGHCSSPFKAPSAQAPSNKVEAMTTHTPGSANPIDLDCDLDSYVGVTDKAAHSGFATEEDAKHDSINFDKPCPAEGPNSEVEASVTNSPDSVDPNELDLGPDGHEEGVDEAVHNGDKVEEVEHGEYDELEDQGMEDEDLAAEEHGAMVQDDETGGQVYGEGDGDSEYDNSDSYTSEDDDDYD